MPTIEDFLPAWAKTDPKILRMHFMFFSCENWDRTFIGDKITVLGVESYPAFGPDHFRPQFCEDCFHRNSPQGQDDIVMPSSSPIVEIVRFRHFNLPPLERNILLCFHGQSALNKDRPDVALGYSGVNNTVRTEILQASWKDEPDVSVGGPTMRYPFVVGSSVFCLIPKGRGHWTARLFETMYGGCIPVHLSDKYIPPFEWLDWDSFSIRWPENDVEGVYAYLKNLLATEPERIEAMHKRLAEVLCWTDYHQYYNKECSPYLGAIRELENRTKIIWDA